MAINIAAPPELLRGDSRDMQQLRRYLMQLVDALGQVVEAAGSGGGSGSGYSSASFKTLSVEMLKAVRAEIGRAKIGWAQVQQLEAKVAEICTATIETADIDWANILELTTSVAKIANAEIENADIDFAKVKGLTADKAIITKGVNGKLYVTDLAVTEANMVSLTTGALMVKGQDGSFYQNTVTEEGTIEPVLVEVEGDNLANATIPGGKLIENTITARELNVEEIFANRALMIELTASLGKFSNLFANEAVVEQLRTHLIESDYMKILIRDQSPKIHVQEEEPTENIQPGDFWIVGKAAVTWEELAEASWAAQEEVTWAALGAQVDENPKTYIYDGLNWTLTADAGMQKETYTLSIRTAEQLLEYAKKTTVDALTGKVTEQEAQLKLNAEEIEARVRKDGVIAAINLTSETAKIQAAKIILEGLVTANSYFKVLTDGSIEAKNANISGKVTASSGAIGGWNIGEGLLYAGSGTSYVALSTADATYRMWAGAAAAASAPFRVSKAGKLVAADAEITGKITSSSGQIGGWSISEGLLYAGSGTAYMALTTVDATYRMWAGASTGASAPFRVERKGKLYASNAEITGKVTASSGAIGGWNIGTGLLEAGSGAEYVALSTADATYRMWAGAAAAASAPFRVSKAGKLFATNAEITGKVTADSGTIGGWSIGDGLLHSGSGTEYVALSTADDTYRIWAGAAAAASAPFRVAKDGRVTMKDAVIAGNLSQDGYSVLTQKQLVISSTEPVGAANMVWVKPVSDVTLTYMHGVTETVKFSVYNTAQKLTLQGSATSGSGTYRYTMTVPYKTTTTLEKTRTLTVTITGSGGKTVVLTTTLSNTGGYTGTAELSTTSSVWLGDSADLTFTMTLAADSTSQDYDYHRVTPGTIQLMCTAKSDATSGWSAAEIKVYQ